MTTQDALRASERHEKPSERPGTGLQSFFDRRPRSASTQTLVVEDFPTTVDARALSPNGRAHWTTKRAARLSVASEVKIAATQQQIRPVAGPVRLTFRYVFPDQRKRDVDNLTTGVTKCVIDALVRGRWLVADDSEHVVEVKAEAVVERSARRLEIEISGVSCASAGCRAGHPASPGPPAGS